MTVRLQKTKKQRIMQHVLETISHGSKPIPAKQLAGVLGKIVAKEPALGDFQIILFDAAVLFIYVFRSPLPYFCLRIRQNTKEGRKRKDKNTGGGSEIHK